MKALVLPFYFLAAAVLLAGCATASMNKITGYSPEDGSCRVLVLESGTRRVLHTEEVRGRFSIGYALGEEFPKRVHVQGQCGGKTVREISNVVPGAIGTTDLGSLFP